LQLSIAMAAGAVFLAAMFIRQIADDRRQIAESWRQSFSVSAPSSSRGDRTAVAVAITLAVTSPGAAYLSARRAFQFNRLTMRSTPASARSDRTFADRF
ncbi:hypothetical protein EN826_034290, partial [Mesorhizobium sp. M1D.F.Ca.ET.183.01.1.1]|uniref:hypothetical protein n=1 Tax=Mesorhizobium sp. M1D.F.Ca.ET.183.01.1.1 TaxID=2496666 RepID=UPI001093F203